MSWSERSVQDHKRRTDCAIHRAFAQLACDPLTRKKFQQLLTCAWQRAPRLLEAPVSDGYHPGVAALVNLSRFRGAHVRTANSWSGTSSSWRPAVSSLAHHLVCGYKVPAFLASCWYAADEAADRKRRWFVAHSRGVRFRSLDLPIEMTRKMEHIFLASQDHVPIEDAMRRAELLALGAPAEFVRAILSTRMATDLRDSQFWRSVWLFLIANAGEVDPMQIGPMIDFIEAVRQDQIAAGIRAGTQNGMAGFGAPQPAFSMRGRTVQSIVRMMQEWHLSLGAKGASLSWGGLPLNPLIVEELSPDGSEMSGRWQLTELVNSAQLRKEGAELRHCVASYAGRCYRGSSSIWSLRLWQAKKIHHVLTVEVDPKRRTVIQARGRANRAPSGRPLRLLEAWAIRERLAMDI